MSENALIVPPILVPETVQFSMDDAERTLLTTARRLFDGGFFDHALLDVWNAAVHNLRRRVEAYGTDLFESVVQDEPGRRRYVSDGETINDRWAGVDDLVLISGATRLGLLSRKAGKALEMINWMRNHASAAHNTDEPVGQADVIALAMILQKNLFERALPDPGHSVGSIFEPVRRVRLGDDELEILRDQIKCLRPQDLRHCLGFLVDMLCRGQEPALSNTRSLLPAAWERASQEQRKVVGVRYQTLSVTPSVDESNDRGARLRLLEFLVQVSGVSYIPDGARVQLYRRAAQMLAEAKDRNYGWADEVAAARTLEQFGPYVPSIAFEEVYQEILAVWCGNYWGRSGARSHLSEFIDSLNTERLLTIVRMFVSNSRVQDELSNPRPKGDAIRLLETIKERLTIATHQAEVDSAIRVVRAL